MLEHLQKLDTNLYKCDLILLLQHCVPWSFNRKIDNKKINELYEVLCNNCENEIVWMFHVAKDTRNIDTKLTILDGHHRFYAIHKYFVNDIETFINRTIYFYIYNIEDPELNTLTLNLFKKINNNVQISEGDIVDKRIVDIVNLLCKRFSKGIQQKDCSTTAHKPKIHKKELKLLFENNRDLLNTLSIDKIIDNIIYINTKLLSYSNTDLIIKSNDNIKIIKARELDFMLNIPKYPPNYWIQYITNISNF